MLIEQEAALLLLLLPFDLLRAVPLSSPTLSVLVAADNFEWLVDKDAAYSYFLC